MPDQPKLIEILECGELEVLGLMPYASNATLLAKVAYQGDECLAVYKPRRGERPLWDFPSGTLCLRERAAYVVSELFGWGLVPPTVLRDGPAGFGALQLFIEEDEEADVRNLLNTHLDVMQKIALFDVVVNNADRKAGHLLIDTDARVWSIDHGVCFHEEPKLRTVIWAFEQQEIPAGLLADLKRVVKKGFRGLEELLSPDELTELESRVIETIRSARYPSPDPGRYHVPWPPW